MNARAGRGGRAGTECDAGRVPSPNRTVIAPSPYETLGLSEHARPEDVRRAHRRLVRLYHPDRNPEDAGAAEAFIEVQQAYEALTADPDAGFDAERVAAVAEQAAAEARRRRAGGGAGADAWPVVAVALHRTAAERATAALARPVGWVGVALAVGLAAASVVALPVPVCLAIAVAGFLVAVRAAAPPPAVVETHWDGLRDLRWDVRIAWDDVASVCEGRRALDLTLAPAAARRLRGSLPARAFAGADVYRLPLAEPARLGALVRERVEA